MSPSVVAHNSRDEFFEALQCRQDISNRTCTLRIDGHLGKYFGILSRLINGKSKPSDCLELFRLNIITLVEFLQENNVKQGEMPRGIFDVLREHGNRLELSSPIPEDLLTEEFCFLAVKANLRMFRYIPDKLKSTKILRYALQQKPEYIQFVPVDSCTEALVQIALDNTNYPLISHIPKEVKTSKILSLIKEHDDKSQFPCHLKLAYQLPDSLTEEACFNACAENGGELTLVPDKLKTERVCRKAGETLHIAPDFFPTERMTEELAYFAVKTLDNLIKKIPARLKTERICLAAVKSNPYLLDYVPAETITRKMCDLYFNEANLINYIPPRLVTESYVSTVIKKKKYKSYLYIPDKYRTSEIDQQTLSYLASKIQELSVYLSPFKDRKDSPVVAERLIRLLIRDAQKNISSLDVNRVRLLLNLLPHVDSFIASDFRERIIDIAQRAILEYDRAKISFSELLYWIQSPYLTKAFKHKCLNHFHHVEQPCSIKRTTHHHLINLSNPLEYELLQNASLREFAELSGNIPLFCMPEQEAGDRLIESIHQASEVFDFEMLEEHHYQKINDSSAFCDGRTLRVETDNGVFHYKLQRQNEDPAELARESAIHQYLAAGKARALGLKSEIPVSQQLFKLPLNQVPVSYVEQLEALEIHTDDNNQPFVYGYCYRTDSMSYGTYAWKPDTKPLFSMSLESRFSQGEEGMLLACHDLGRWCAMGILHTSILPAFHDTESKRRWMALHQALGSPLSADNNFCGTFGAWNSSATGRTDLRYSGLADLVDYERFGEVASYFSFKEGYLLCNMPMTLQRLALGNYIVETLLATILIYARLHEDDPEYHIASKTGEQKLTLFIKKAVAEFLKGLTCSQHPPSLAEVLGISEDDCSCWLKRTVQEILYWTGGVKSTKDGTVLNETVINFANDLLKKNQLNSMLYSSHKVKNGCKKYPDNFHNINGKLNLGSNSRLFPLLSLVQGLTKLSTNIIYLLGTNATGTHRGGISPSHKDFRVYV